MNISRNRLICYEKSYSPIDKFGLSTGTLQHNDEIGLDLLFFSLIELRLVRARRVIRESSVEYSNARDCVRETEGTEVELFQIAAVVL